MVLRPPNPIPQGGRDPIIIIIIEGTPYSLRKLASHHVVHRPHTPYSIPQGGRDPILTEEAGLASRGAQTPLKVIPFQVTDRCR